MSVLRARPDARVVPLAVAAVRQRRRGHRRAAGRSVSSRPGNCPMSNESGTDSHVLPVPGTWTDADGNTGSFVFNPPGVGGLPRPLATRPALIASAQLASSIFAGTGSQRAGTRNRRELVGSGDELGRLPLERERRRAGNDLQSMHLRQRVDDFCSETVDVGHRLESTVGILGEAAPDDLLQRRRRLQRARIVAQHGAEDLGRGVAREGPSARKQFIQPGAEAEYVRPSVERLGCRLLGGHVRWRSDHVAGDRSRRAGIRARELCDTEVEQLSVRGSALPNDHDIGRLQIAVKNAGFVRCVQSVSNLDRQPHSFVSSNRTAEWFPLEILEDKVSGPTP